MSFGHAIYYPHIHLTNKNWLKYAVLYWDKISRIVPSSIQPADDKDVIRLRSELDFVDDYIPNMEDMSSAADRFFGWFATQATSSDLQNYYASRYGIHRSEIFRHDLTPPIGWRKKLRGDLADALHSAALANGTYIHVDKLDRRLKEFLFATGIAVPGEDELSDWVRIDTEVGLLYMSYLARSIASDTSRSVVTDLLPTFVTSEAIASAISHNRQDELQHRMGTLLIAAYSPSDLNSVTFEQLIEFRQRHEAERRAFFDHVDSLCRSISAVKSEADFKDALNHHLPNLIKDADEAKKWYVHMRIDPVLRFISISVPTSCVSLTNLVPAESKGVVLAAGIVLGAANAMHERTKEKHQEKERPLSYLQSLESGLNTGGIVKRIHAALRRIG